MEGELKIPVFVSCATDLSPEQEASRRLVLSQLSRNRLEPRALGRSDYPTEYPLREVHVIAKHCAGGVILGFEQFRSTGGIWKRGSKSERKTKDEVLFPTPWNQLEAGILFGLGLPLLIFREVGISGGVFDPGVTDVFVHDAPTSSDGQAKREQFRDVFLKWQSRVRERYYAQ